MATNAPKAALLMIGNEILSGRTQDKNLNHLANALLKHGIVFAEARVIQDDEQAIIKGVNSLRADYDYVFTCGGIGPTHDDITAESIAKAFEVPLIYHEEAMKILTEHYKKTDREFTKNRQRMARTPMGALLIENLVSAAPGFIQDNVFVMAGVPAIFQAMVDAVMPSLSQGPKIHSLSFSAMVAESEIAEGLSAIADKYKDVDIGCYPAWTAGKPCVSLVLRTVNEQALTKASDDVKTLLSPYQMIG